MEGFDGLVVMLQDTYDAFNSRDIDRVLSHFHPDVEWPNLIELTTARGHRAVRTYWEKQFAVISPTVMPQKFTDLGDTIVVNARQVVRDLDGNVLTDVEVAHAFRFRGGLVAGMQVRAPIV